MSSSEDNSDGERTYASRFRTVNGFEGIEESVRIPPPAISCITYRPTGDGTETAGYSCTNCSISKTQCTYAEPSKRRFGVSSE
ncbi:hypothetical protein JB92DRAFT_2930777 [Gautieria morchelliformis]|nr:hypothetical protein JB92DRAFT_2930777 [Gautieria morchelliformis]